MADRAEMLRKMLEKDPDDAFSRYALAMEDAKAGRAEEALAGYAEVVRRNPTYVPAYQMAGQLLMEEGRYPEARGWLERGVAVADEAGNSKASSEMGDLLSEVEIAGG